MATCKRWIKSCLRPYQTMSKKGLFIAFLVIVGFTTIFTTQAFAQVTSADYPDLLDHWYETFAFDMYADALQAGVDDTFGILTLTNDVSSSDVSSIIKVIYDALLALGEALLLTFFLAELTDKMTKQVIDIETMLRMCLKYLIAYALIKNGAMVLESILGIGTKLAAGITDIKFDSAVDFYKRLAQYIQDTSWIGDIFLGILGVIPWLFAKVLSIFIMATAYGRIFQIIIYGSLAPIGCAPIVQEGFSGHGMRYLKRYAAVCMQGAIIALILVIGEQVKISVMEGLSFDESFSGCLAATMTGIVVTVAEVVSITQSKQIANDVLNV